MYKVLFWYYRIFVTENDLCGYFSLITLLKALGDGVKKANLKTEVTRKQCTPNFPEKKLTYRYAFSPCTLFFL